MRLNIPARAGLTVKDKILQLSVLVIAALFCFVKLSLKPPHSDESVNGFFVNQIWENGFFTYDPGNYHGPLLFYLFQVSEKIFGFGIHSLRIVTALFSFLTVSLILLSKNALGRYAYLFVALTLGLSPGMIFFGRSAIHESAFVFFQILWMLGFLKSRESPDREGFLWFFTGFLGCILLKETFVILGISFIMAWVWLEVSFKVPYLINKQTGSPGPIEVAHIQKPILPKTIFTITVVWFAFYTGFFHHWKGASDFFIAIMPWLKTGTGGSGHDKPFYYWLMLFRQYEWGAVIGLIASFAGVLSRSWKIRFFSALALVNWLIYSYIPYKTPWCVISILWPFVFVVGLWIEIVFAKARPKKILASVSLSLALVVLVHSAVTSYRLNFRDYANPSGPYVYVQTKNDFKIIEDIIGSKTGTSPDFHNMTVTIRLDDPWPLPWFFSRFPNVRYGDYRESVKPEGDIIFAETGSDDAALAGLYLRRLIDLRDARKPIYVYLKASTFDTPAAPDGAALPGFSMVRLKR